MTAAPVQASLFPILPYAGKPGAARHSATSQAAAEAIRPYLGKWQTRVLLALYKTPGLTCRALDRRFGTELTRRSWPRISELQRFRLPDGTVVQFVQQCGQCIEETGRPVGMWELTPAGLALARELLEAQG